MPMSAARADESLSDALNSPATPHVWVHTADPGAAGTGGVAEDPGTDPVDRQPVTFAAPSNHPSNEERRCLSTAVVEWEGADIEPGQSITHVSTWSAASAGTVEFIYELPAPVVVGSDGLRIEEGDLEHAIEVYAKP